MALLPSKFQWHHLGDFSVGFVTTLVGSFPVNSFVGTFLVITHWVASQPVGPTLQKAGFLLPTLTCGISGNFLAFWGPRRSFSVGSESQPWVKEGPSSKYVPSSGTLTQL